MSANGRLLGISLVLLTTAVVLVFVTLGQFRSYDQAMRLCEELRRTSASLQASADQFAKVSGGASNAQSPSLQNPRGGSLQNAQFDRPIPELPNGETLKAYNETLVKRNQTQHEQDKTRYDVGLAALYKQAQDDEDSGSRETNHAFGELVDKYPDANVTGMAIADRGLRAAMKQRTEDVEMFRNMLSRKEPFKRIVTDSYVDAYPSLCGYLANRYVMLGRTADAEKLLDELLTHFANSFVAVGGFGSKPMLVPVDSFVERVRTEAQRHSQQPPAPPRREGSDS